MVTSFLAVGCVAFPENGGGYYDGRYDQRNDRRYDRDDDRYERERNQQRWEYQQRQKRLELDRKKRDLERRQWEQNRHKQSDWERRKHEQQHQLEQRKKQHNKIVKNHLTGNAKNVTLSSNANPAKNVQIIVVIIMIQEDTIVAIKSTPHSSPCPIYLGIFDQTV